MHEINARFSQAMANTSLTDVDFKTYARKKGKWKSVLREFQIEFLGWKLLSDKMKRKLTRRLAKAYQEEIDKINLGGDE